MGERGAGSPLVLGVACAVLLLAVAVMGVSTVLAAGRRADTVADLAALASARAVLDGAGSPCEVARAVADANGAELGSCAVQPDESVQVETSVRVSVGPLRMVTALHGVARAGPVWDSGPLQDSGPGGSGAGQGGARRAGAALSGP